MAKNNIDNLIKSKLLEYGFKKKGYYFIKEFSSNIIYSIIFGKASYGVKGHSFVSPSIGIGYKNVNELEATLCGCKNSIGPTIWQGLGYLMSEKNYKEWDFLNDGNNDAVLSEMFSAIFQYGEEYWKEMSNFDNLFEAVFIRTPGLLNDRRERLLPILYYLRGEKAKGIDFINETIQKRSRRPTDEELLRGRSPENTILLRAGEGPKHTAEDFEKMLKSLPNGGCIEIVGPGYNGYIDPAYLEFVERYKAL